jgi:hypothetical protein
LKFHKVEDLAVPTSVKAWKLNKVFKKLFRMHPLTTVPDAGAPRRNFLPSG